MTDIRYVGFRKIMDQALMSRDPVSSLEEVESSGLLKELAEEAYAMVGFGGLEEGHKDLWAHVRQVVAQTLPILTMRWAALFHDVGKVPTFQRINGEVTFHGHELASASLFMKFARRSNIFSKDEREHIYFLVRNLGNVEAYQSNWTDSAVRRLHKDVGDGLGELVQLAKADVTTKHEWKRMEYRSKLDELLRRAEKLAADDAIPQALPTGLGDVLMKELSLPPGRELGVYMKKLKDSVESGKLPRNAGFDIYLEAIRNGL